MGAHCVIVLSLALALASVRAQSVIPTVSLCQSNPETVVTPDKYPSEAPTCVDYANLLPQYSYKPKCLAIYNKLRCNWDSWNYLIGLPDWTIDDLDTLCGHECDLFTLDFFYKLADNSDPGCSFLPKATYDLCSTRNMNQYCFDYDAGAFYEDLQAYWAGINTQQLRARCLGLSVCDENKWFSLKAYFRIDGVGEYEDLFDDVYPDWKDQDTSLIDMCNDVLNLTVESVTYLDPDIDSGVLWDTYESLPFFTLSPYFIVDKGEGTSECNATTAVSPSLDGTCPSFDDWISTSGANEACVKLVRNVRCNVDTVASVTSPGFFLTSEVESMCTGVCAPYIKYVVETLGAQNTSSEPGCDVIRTSLEGICTQYTWSNQTDFCASRGSAFARAFKTEWTQGEGYGNSQFASVCPAYSCCEDVALAALPSYFDLTSENSTVELVLRNWFPDSFEAKNITTAGLCTEFAKVNSNIIIQIGSNGDTCSSTLDSVIAFKPVTASPTASPTTSSPTASPTLSPSNSTSNDTETASPTVSPNPSPTSADPSSSSETKALSTALVMLALACWIAFLFN